MNCIYLLFVVCEIVYLGFGKYINVCLRIFWCLYCFMESLLVKFIINFKKNCFLKGVICIDRCNLKGVIYDLKGIISDM